MMQIAYRWICLAVLLFMAGCTALRPDTPRPEPSTNSAVVSLLNKARTQSTAGQLHEASASLERAVRIEPRNPYLWQELARVRLEQGLYRQAENLAAKSNSLITTDTSLRRENWRIIGQARTKQGDLQGARSAFDKAAQL
ncbi:MAG: tetratricopeptide repeat protein [Pedobacter sp.]